MRQWKLALLWLKKLPTLPSVFQRERFLKQCMLKVCEQGRGGMLDCLSRLRTRTPSVIEGGSGAVFVILGPYGSGVEALWRETLILTCCPMEDDMMEAWLDDHLQFTHSYFVRKASREMVNAWFAERVHTIKPATSKDSPPTLDNVAPTTAATNQPPATPPRKISASEFDRPLPPIVVKDSEGSVTFLSDTDRPSAPPEQGCGVAVDGEDGGGGRAVGDPCTRLLGLVKDVASHLDVTALCHKIFLHINQLIAADRYSLFLVGEDSSNKKFLVSRLFDVAEGSTLEESSSSCIRLEWNKGIVGHVAATGQPLNIKNAYQVVGVAQAINKKHGEDGAFSQQDEKDFSAYLAFSGIVLHNAQLYETSQLENRRNQVLLELASLLFEEQQSVEVLLRRFAGTILSFMMAQSCTVFIADNDSTQNPFSSVFHMDYEELGQVLNAPKSVRDCVSQMNYMYAQYVKNTMQPLNIADVAEDQRFPFTCEHQSGKPPKSLLCTPIKNGKKDKVIGVCQLVNKADEASGSIKTFNRNDEQFLEAFAVFCGLAIQNTQMYETVERAMAQQQVTLEVLSYHASAASEESQELQVAVIPSAQSLRLLDFNFSDFELSDAETALGTVRMFLDLNLVQTFQMKHMSLCQWILSVKKNYRKNIAYHNWRHAFNTAQCMFALLRSGRLQNNLRDLEVLALMISTLCHDLDHRGVNNSYIHRSDHPLAHLYCHSTMEHHHFDQCLMILNSPGNQILSSLSLEEYKSTLKMIEMAILSTDLALYIKRREEFFELTKNKQFVWEDEHHRDLLRSMLMTACDISAITKPWPVQKKIAELVATEFYEQGDKERQELNMEPSDLMNREKRDKIPSMQVSFIDAICTPLYETLATMSEYCSPLLEGCQTNRQHWKCLAKECDKEDQNSLV
ncbi:cGMP-specific 3',5'-cyclic phosphodiesterase isoform X2 [Dunckerocampus dactyliophorus]|uniref:cGMP-specific 3',5'-cyclic phosphodiesterase isoform X2 n=1 Tax=Dunckerocampus dactyliophorus TaxID=161453 RepID=UPI0024060298|nr:cGMP-specific 3',5'-cyclic phosphodiesterase isoform X2 [Dunckerocampus dactyliophorus]